MSGFRRLRSGLSAFFTGTNHMASAKRNSRSNGSSEPTVRHSESPARQVLCIKNQGYQASREVRKIYKVLPDAEAARHGLLRVVDESVQDYLYPKGFFVPISLAKAAVDALSAS